MTRSAFSDHEVEATANSSTATVEPPDDPLWSPWRSGIVVGAAAPYVFFQKVLQTFPSVMREWLVVDRSLNEAGFGGLSSSFYNPYIPLQIPAGILVTRFGPRAALITGALLCAVASFPFSLSETADFAEATRIPMGLNAAPTVVCALTLATQRLPRPPLPATGDADRGGRDDRHRIGAGNPRIRCRAGQLANRDDRLRRVLGGTADPDCVPRPGRFRRYEPVGGLADRILLLLGMPTGRDRLGVAVGMVRQARAAVIAGRARHGSGDHTDAVRAARSGGTGRGDVRPRGSAMRATS